ncbi:unnamed protein product [Auanema sp. JU1783]|nr:unnamed protein product [Auanema sp. JU1783]
MDLEEVFCSTGVNPRSHCIALCEGADIIVYAADGHLVAELVPAHPNLPGKVINVSERHHSKPITVVKRISASSDNYFLSGCNHGDVNLWAFKNNKFEHILKLDKLPISVTSLAGTARQNELILVGSWGGVSTGIRSWWLTQETGGKWIVRTTKIIEEASKSFALSIAVHILPTGNALLAAGTSLRKIDLYVEGKDKEIFTPVLSVIGHNDWIHSVSFNNNNNSLLLASAGQDSYVRLWRISENSNSVDDNELSVTKNKFNVETAQGDVVHTINVEAVLAGHEDWVHSTEFNSDGSQIVTSSSDKTAIIWKEIDGIWTDWLRVGVVGGQAAGFFSAVFTNNSEGLVASSYFGGLHAWRLVNENEPWAPISMIGGHTGEVRDLSWEPKGRYLISVGSDKTTRLFSKLKEQETYGEIARPQVHGHEMQCVCSISSTCFVSGGEEKIYRAFQAPITFANSYEAISGVSKEKVFNVEQLAETGARMPALGLSNKAVEVDAPVENEETHWEEEQFLANPSNLEKVPTEDCLQQNTLWPELQKLYGHGFEVYAIATNPTGTVLATSCKASQAEHAVVILWDISNWTLKKSVLGHNLTITQIEWSPSGEYLLTVSRDRTAILYKERNGDIHGFDYEKVWQSKDEHSRIIWSCSWFSNSSMFATASRDKKVILWQIDGNEAKVFASETLPQPITAVAVSRRNIVACGLQDGSITLLGVENSQIVSKKAFITPAVTVDAAVQRLRFSNAEKEELAYAGIDGKVRIFRIC